MEKYINNLSCESNISKKRRNRILFKRLGTEDLIIEDGVDDNLFQSSDERVQYREDCMLLSSLLDEDKDLPTDLILRLLRVKERREQMGLNLREEKSNLKRCKRVREVKNSEEEEIFYPCPFCERDSDNACDFCEYKEYWLDKGGYRAISLEEYGEYSRKIEVNNIVFYADLYKGKNDLLLKLKSSIPMEKKNDVNFSFIWKGIELEDITEFWKIALGFASRISYSLSKLFLYSTSENIEEIAKKKERIYYSSETSYLISDLKRIGDNLVYEMELKSLGSFGHLKFNFGNVDDATFKKILRIVKRAEQNFSDMCVLIRNHFYEM